MNRHIMKIVNVEQRESRNGRPLMTLTLQDTQDVQHRLYDHFVLIRKAEWRVAQLLDALKMLDPDTPDWLDFNPNDFMGMRVRVVIDTEQRIRRYERPYTQHKPKGER